MINDLQKKRIHTWAYYKSIDLKLWLCMKNMFQMERLEDPLNRSDLKYINLINLCQNLGTLGLLDSLLCRKRHKIYCVLYKFHDEVQHPIELINTTACKGEEFVMMKDTLSGIVICLKTICFEKNVQLQPSSIHVDFEISIYILYMQVLF